MKSQRNSAVNSKMNTLKTKAAKLGQEYGLDVEDSSLNGYPSPAELFDGKIRTKLWEQHISESGNDKDRQSLRKTIDQDLNLFDTFMNNLRLNTIVNRYLDTTVSNAIGGISKSDFKLNSDDSKTRQFMSRLAVLNERMNHLANLVNMCLFYPVISLPAMKKLSDVLTESGCFDGLGSKVLRGVVKAGATCSSISTLPKESGNLAARASLIMISRSIPFARALAPSMSLLTIGTIAIPLIAKSCYHLGLFKYADKKIVKKQIESFVEKNRPIIKATNLFVEESIENFKEVFDKWVIEEDESERHIQVECIKIVLEESLNRDFK